MSLDPDIKQVLIQCHTKLDSEGKLLSPAKLTEYYETFKTRFGPDVLSNLDGEELLTTMHDHSNRGNSLVYWLEFKNDEELPAVFGGIGGGSALKFGLYRKNETGEWMTGSSKLQKKLSTEEAVIIAREQRNHLIKGCELLDMLPKNGSEDDYRNLQQKMNELAPSVSDFAWGHKYFHMLFHEKIEDFHNPDYQRFHLIKLLITPPQGKGRYITAVRYVEVAQELEWPLNHLTSVLNNRNGSPYRYWRIGTSSEKSRDRWDIMRDGNCVAVGWAELGDLSDISYIKSSKERIRELMVHHYPRDARITGKQTNQIFNFIATINEGDLVIASDGAKVIGIGRVNEGYSYDSTSDFPHRRGVEWYSLNEWKMTSPEGLQTTVHEVRKYPENQIEVEKQIFSGPVTPPVSLVKLTGIPAKIETILKRKAQVIIYGPPGTGKTYWAELTAKELAARNNFNKQFSDLDEEQKALIAGTERIHPSYVKTCCFHPSYGYEDFIEGYRPIVNNDQMHFQLRNGIFKKLCIEAIENPSSTYYLIIDEINRGDISRIFGELLMILEKNKRGKSVQLPLSGNIFSVPENVFIIATMNTADRSIALLDKALRRRFGFLEFMPDISILKNVVLKGIPVGLWLESLNKRILENVGRDARNLQIGHSYLMEQDKPITRFTQFVRIIREDIIPLLEEYCYEDYSILEKILGNALISRETMTIHEELFDGSNDVALISALLAPTPDISTSSQVIDSEAETPEDNEDEETDSDSNGIA